MAFTLTLNNISPTTAANTGNVSLILNYYLSGDGISLPAFSVDLYDAATGGNHVKSLYYSDYDEPSSGYAITVSFAGVSPGTYYVQLFYRVIGTPRRAITITGSSSGINNISLNGNQVSANTHNGSSITSETLNGTKIYGT